MNPADDIRPTSNESQEPSAVSSRLRKGLIIILILVTLGVCCVAAYLIWTALQPVQVNAPTAAEAGQSADDLLSQ